MILFFFFFNDTATTEIYTLSLHDALPISGHSRAGLRRGSARRIAGGGPGRDRARFAAASGRVSRRRARGRGARRSEEHTSELQSRPHLVCRLLLEKKKTRPITSLPPSAGR